MTARHYCMTFFREPQWELIGESKKVRYFIAGTELCPKTGKKHWQAYIELTAGCRMPALKKAVDDASIHIEKRQGTRDQARDYCMKDGDFREIGKWDLKPGKRTDLEAVVDTIKNGAKLKDVALENPEMYCRYRNGLRDIAAYVAEDTRKEFRKVEVILMTGPTGCGKTRKAMEEATYKINGSELNWWDGYTGDECILIDEYDNDVPITKLLNLLDGYCLRLPIKGGFTYAAWTKVFITTNLTEERLHSNAKDEHRNALFRRITKIDDFWPK